MKKNQLNLKNTEEILTLKDFDVRLESLNNYPTDPPVFFIKIDNQSIDISIGFDLEDFVKMNKFLKKIVKKTKLQI
jgi:hypothetical protein